MRAPLGVLFCYCLFLPWISPPALGDAAIEDRLRELDARIQEYPDQQQWRIRRARVYIDTGLNEAAMEDIRAAEVLGDPAEAAFVHGLLLYRQGQLSGARKQFDIYLQAHPGHRQSLDYRARLLRDAGEYEAALADYRQLMAMDDSLAPGYYLSAARMLAALPDHGTDEALALLDGRMEQVGPVSSLQRFAIGLESGRGNYDAAIGRMATLDEKLRGTPEWHAEMAGLQLQAGRPLNALDHIAVAEEQLARLKQTGARRRLAEELAILKRRARQAADQPSE